MGGYTAHALYYFYIDESGTDTRVSNPSKKTFGSDWFTAGGIIVDDAGKAEFENVHKAIMHRYFASNGIKIDAKKFKLHYNELRQKRPPYDNLSYHERRGIANDVFDAICRIDCTLISVSINKEKHASKYVHPAPPKTYTLLACLERFQFFLEDNGGGGIAYYEEFTNAMRRKITEDMYGLQSITDFHSTLGKIKGKVRTGKPSTDVILQFSDFFVYAPQINFVTNHAKKCRLEQIYHKYYRGLGWKRKGFALL